MKNFGEQFLHQKDSKLHTSQPVEHEKKRLEIKGEEISQKPVDKIGDWLEVIEKTHTSHTDDPRVLERIKNYYHKENVIKAEDVPESTFLLEQIIARNQGRGTIEITDESRKQKTNEIIFNQEKSLDKWVDYLSSPDATYPMWAKYWAFNSMLKMGKMEKSEDEETKVETLQFKKRAKDTVASFPALNPRALAMTISVIAAKAEQNSINKNERITPENVSKKLDDAKFKELLSTENFSKIYAQFLIEMPEYSTEGLKETRGQWKTYKQDSEPDELVQSLDGHPLEWCTANIDTARTQLQGGDFHVYYSINEKGEAVIPRVAIRMEGDKIAEVRGIAAGQNMDPYIGDVVKEKMTEFPDGEKYEKKSADMKHLTEIEEKNNRQEELSKDDLKFLYEKDSKIDGFGYEKDPRIEELINKRDVRSDLSLVTGFKKEEIAITKKEALGGDFKYYHFKLNLSNLKSAEGLKLPQSIGGNLGLNGLESAEGLSLPQFIGRDLELGRLISAEGLKLPQSIRGNLDLNDLKSAEGLKLPKSIGGHLYLGSLTSAKDLKLPDSISGVLYLGSLESAKDLNLLQHIDGGLNLNCLESAEGLNLPQHIGGSLNLDRLKSAEGLNLPQFIGGGLYLRGLKSVEDLNLPQFIGEGVYLRGIESTELKEFKSKYPQYKYKRK